METQDGLKIQDEVTINAYKNLNINLEINIFGEVNKTRNGVVKGVLDFIIDHQSIRKNEIEVRYFNKKKGLNSIQQYILDRAKKREIEETNNEYSDTKELCILFNSVLKELSIAENIINNQKLNSKDLSSFEELFVDASINSNLLSNFKDDLMRISNIDFKEVDKSITKMESILKNTKESIRFYIPSENKSSNFKDYMLQAVESLKTILLGLKKNIESYEYLGDTIIEFDDVESLENRKATKQTV